MGDPKARFEEWDRQGSDQGEKDLQMETCSRLPNQGPNRMARSTFSKYLSPLKRRECTRGHAQGGLTESQREATNRRVVESEASSANGSKK